jgi:threonine synthase
MNELDRLRDAGDASAWAIVATAHPAKFEGVVEPLVGGPVAIPLPLASLLERRAHATPLSATTHALVSWLREGEDREVATAPIR